MSYVTLEVEINGGKVSSKGTEILPDKASGLLTILNPASPGEARPIGLAKGLFIVPDDFNAPLPEEVLHSFEGR